MAFRIVMGVLAVLATCGSAWASGEAWDTATLADEDTLEFFTVNGDGEEHWATVWFVDIDGDLYIRLGDRAESRIRENVHQPHVNVRVGDRVYEKVVAEEAPDKVGEVVDLMQDKYWSAVFIKMMPDRFTVRLRQPSEATP